MEAACNKSNIALTASVTEVWYKLGGCLIPQTASFHKIYHGKPYTAKLSPHPQFLLALGLIK